MHTILGITSSIRKELLYFYCGGSSKGPPPTQVEYKIFFLDRVRTNLSLQKIEPQVILTKRLKLELPALGKISNIAGFILMKEGNKVKKTFSSYNY